jgi:antitoxin (DNA-binding transcriptional repressor) of toxin-antitoxin stability system
MARDVIHISEAEAASDFAALMARMRAGAKIVIENGELPVAVLHAAEPVRRSISDCIALAKAHEEETSKAPVLDPDFAEDVEEILSHRKPWNPPAWGSSSTQASLSLPNAEAILFGKSWNK